MFIIEFKIRYSDDFRKWEDIDVSFSRYLQDHEILPELETMINQDIKEIRWNYAGSPQGHYFNAWMNIGDSE